jgi:hypothetical protein
MREKAENDPHEPGPFGRLMLGESSTAPEDAAAIIETLEPSWVPTHIRGDFGLPPMPKTHAN